MKNTFLKLKAFGLICCMTLFSAVGLNANPTSAVETSTPKGFIIIENCKKLFKVKGKPLGSEPINSFYELALKMVLKKHGFATAVELFKNAITRNALLAEAIFQTNRAVVLAQEELRILCKEINNETLASSDSQQAAMIAKEFEANFAKMLVDEHLTNVKKGVILVLKALQQYAISKGYVNQLDGKPNIRGKVFIATVSAIIKHSLKHYNLHEKSVMLAMLDSLYDGTKGVEKSLVTIEKIWQDPVKAMELLLEIQIFIGDICLAVPAVKNIVDARSPDKFFEACDQKMEEERLKALALAAAKKK